jgi:hypothetical protein
MVRRYKDRSGAVVAVIATFVVLFNLAWIGLLTWGLVELIKFISRH